MGSTRRAMPLAISSALRVFLNRVCWKRLKNPATPLFEFGLRSGRSSIRPSRLASARQLLPWTFGPYSTFWNRRSTSRGHASPLCSALRVWLPSRRLTPFDAAPVLFHTDSAPGVLPFEAFPSRKVTGTSPSRLHPHTVSHAVDTPADGRGTARHAAVPGLRPSQESLALATRYYHAGGWMLPWVFSLLGCANHNAARGFLRSLLSRAWDCRTTTPTSMCTSEY